MIIIVCFTESTMFADFFNHTLQALHYPESRKSQVPLRLLQLAPQKTLLTFSSAISVT